MLNKTEVISLLNKLISVSDADQKECPNNLLQLYKLDNTTFKQYVLEEYDYLSVAEL